MLFFFFIVCFLQTEGITEECHRTHWENPARPVRKLVTTNYAVSNLSLSEYRITHTLNYVESHSVLNLSMIAKLLWHTSDPHLTLSCGPHTTWNDGAWAVRSCLPDSGHKQARAMPHVPHFLPKVAHICFVIFGPYSLFTTWSTLGSRPDYTLP